VVGLAGASYGVILARQGAPSRMAGKLPLLGKADPVQRRLDWRAGCRVWGRWVLRHYSGRRLVLLVDATKLGERLSVLVVGLAYGGVVSRWRSGATCPGSGRWVRSS
jgi:hypothetical protein